jgi:hypothetical protein
MEESRIASRGIFDQEETRQGKCKGGGFAETLVNIWSSIAIISLNSQTVRVDYPGV